MPAYIQNLILHVEHSTREASGSLVCHPLRNLILAHHCTVTHQLVITASKQWMQADFMKGRGYLWELKIHASSLTSGSSLVKNGFLLAESQALCDQRQGVYMHVWVLARPQNLRVGPLCLLPQHSHQSPPQSLHCTWIKLSHSVLLV